MSEPVRYERRGPVAWVTIERPEARNALNAAVRSGLWAATRRFNADDAEVLVLTGAGDTAFCAGGDLKEMADESLEVPPADFLPHFGRNIEVTKPTIAAVNGMALAGGFLLAQMCDLCVATETATFAITEAKVGRGAPWAVGLPALVGRRMALQLLMTGGRISAQRGYEIGLVNEVVTGADLQPAVQRLAESIAANAPLSVRAAKRMVHESAGLEWAAASEFADRLWEPVYRSGDAQEGPRAFRERRPPRWQAR